MVTGRSTGPIRGMNAPAHTPKPAVRRLVATRWPPTSPGHRASLYQPGDSSPGPLRLRSLKEGRETHYWLRLLARIQTVGSPRLTSLVDESAQLRAILSQAVVTVKRGE